MRVPYKRLDDPPGHAEDEQGALEDYLSWRRLAHCKAKLSNASKMTSLMSFFAVLATVELKLNVGEASPGLIIAMACTTSALLSLTMLVKTVSCSLMPFLDIPESSDVSRSPHDRMISIINGTWFMANVFCPALFILDMILLSWIKFMHIAIEAAYAATAILTPLLGILFIFAIIYYRQISASRELEYFRAILSRSSSSSVGTKSSSSSVFLRSGEGGVDHQRTREFEDALSNWRMYGSFYDETDSLLSGSPYFASTYGSTLWTESRFKCF